MGREDLFKRKKRERTELKRTRGSRGDARDLILIVCEGEKTEPLYFESFGLTNVHIHGAGGDPLTVVKTAIDIRKTEKKDNIYYNQTWCVFDRDSFSADRFNGALGKAQANKIDVAYSNESFELWFLLHFEYLNVGLSRDDYGAKLSKYIGKKYEKCEANMFSILRKLGNQKEAIKRADKLLSYHTHNDPYNNNPSTTVHNLIKELNKWYK
ncbi:hypothetical protein CHR37_07450 [Bacillus velezensis]|uniref:RloB family protein n=1 Tax=Bacillus TaxID=1386 RepID=UPI000B93A76F|nr:MULTISPECIES: RloB family protein [Bacillus]MCX2735679.1 RloB family protein [Bacillus sp. AnS8]OYD12756.1 hypothetical protein CHR37_07450 [Bacillus velezensis]